MDCSICLDNITDDTKKITQCKHTFHEECLTRWLHTNNSCPLCRTHIVHVSEPTLNVPLQFWFNRNPNLAIPLVSIPFASRSIDLNNTPFALYPEDNTPSGSVNYNRTINHYNFSIEPELYQPSGRQNRSRIDDTHLNFYTEPEVNMETIHQLIGHSHFIP